MTDGISLPSAARDLLSSAALAHVVTLNADGSPHVTVAWVGLDGDELVLGTLFDQKKLRNARRDQRVVVSVEGTKVHPPGLKEYLVITGTARVTEGGAPELLGELARTYLGPDVKFPPMEDPPPGFVTRITPTKISGVGPWTG